MGAEVNFSGKSNLLYRDTKCDIDQLERITALAKYTFENTILIEPLANIFNIGYEPEWFKTSFEKSISIIETMYGIPSVIYRRFKELLVDFYVNSKDISNDRGRVIEVICDFGIKKDSGPTEDIKYHCQVEVKYNSTRFHTGETNIDICSKLPTGSNSIESKMGIEARNEKTKRKFDVFTSLVRHFNLIRNSECDHILTVMVFTTSDTKIDYIKKTWPEIDFIGVKGFVSCYCTH